ncbi:MAG: RluA family pseudouridine synthase [Candidatus Sericytochromatia bacterium]
MLPLMPSFTIAPAEDRQRLDHYLANALPAHSRSLIRKWIDGGHVLLNGQPVSKAGHTLHAGDELKITPPELQTLDVIAEDLPLDIVYEDSDLIVINKPVGLVVHPGAGHASGTLVNALLYHCHDLSGIGGVERPGIVHRLDKDTSGLLVVAKNDQTHQHLSAQLQSREMKRHYYALAELNFSQDSGTVEAPIGRHPVDRQRMAVVAEGRFARTHWRVKERFTGYTWLELELDTGRTHQIRVHLKHLQHPLVGDSVYGSRRNHPFKVERPLLHAFQLNLTHPKTGKRHCFEAPLPEDMQRILNLLHNKEG